MRFQPHGSTKLGAHQPAKQLSVAATVSRELPVA
jgi:hypothetical protein